MADPIQDSSDFTDLSIQRTPWGPLWLRTQQPSSDTWLDRIQEWGLAVVGTRRADRFHCSFLERTLAAFEGTELIVVSGLATGIDFRAHELALEMGLRTVAVLAHGLDSVFPKSSERLARRILDRGGALMSEYAPGVPPLPFRFVERNRWIARISRATWVVQAPERSGALHTARFAVEEGRPLFVTAARPGDPATSGHESLWVDCGAIPVFGPHSLGAEWIRFAALGKSSQSVGTAPCGDPAEELARELEQRVRKRTEEAGSITIEEILELYPPARHEAVWIALHHNTNQQKVRRIPAGFQAVFSRPDPTGSA